MTLPMSLPMTLQGTPCWFELCTMDEAAARGFYGPILGWSFQDAGMEGSGYGLALRDGAMVAGLMVPESPMPEAWIVYFAVDHCDHVVAKAKALGANVHRAPEDIPGTGRYALLTDPQGAPFGLLQPEDGTTGDAFDLTRTGHCNWVELHSTDPEAGFQFYAALLGWSAAEAIDMGPNGTYQIFAHDGREIGGMMGMRDMAGGPPLWLPYFGVPGVRAATDRAISLGGRVLHGPGEVPGRGWITKAVGSHGAAFAMVGPG